jgi:hypothetical protein
MQGEKKESRVVYIGEPFEVVDTKDTAEHFVHKDHKGQDKATAKIFKSRKKWPKACVKCGGDGGLMSDDNEESDDIDDIVIDPCPDCLGQGKCPRCAVKLPAGWKEKVIKMADPEDDSDPAECKKCNWEDGDDPVFMVP